MPASAPATPAPASPAPAEPAPASAPAPAAPAKPAAALGSAIIASLHGPASAAVEPFRVVGNIYYVGAHNIASYLITTPRGHILLDTGTREMASVIPASIAKLGFKVSDVKILLSGHAHFDHVQGHAAIQRATGAQVMALGDDAIALETGTDRSPLATEGWDPVKVDRVLEDGDTVSLGGTTLTAVWAPGHTPGCTVWTTSVTEPPAGTAGKASKAGKAGKARRRTYSVLFYACAGPNAGVQLVGNPRFPRLAEDAQASYRKLAKLRPDIFLLMHPADQFKDKVEAIKAGATPHPLYDPQGWTQLIAESEAALQKRIDAENASAR